MNASEIDGLSTSCRDVKSPAGTWMVKMLNSKEEAPESLDELVRPHVESFDYFLGEGLQTVVDLLDPMEVAHPLASTHFLPWIAFASTYIACPSSGVLWRLHHTCVSPLQIEHPGTAKRHRVWFENPLVGQPIKDDTAGLTDKPLSPRDCREGVRTMLTCRIGPIKS